MKLRRTIVAINLAWISQLAAAADTHCTKEESVIFSCKTGQKIVSICATKSISTSSEYPQYRFGRKGSPEMIFPIEKQQSNADIQANTLRFSGGGGAYIRFSTGQYAYVVYTAIGRGWGEKAGIVVEKDHKLQAKLTCKKPVLSELGPDFFQQAGLAEDQRGFELP